MILNINNFAPSTSLASAERWGQSRQRWPCDAMAAANRYNVLVRKRRSPFDQELGYCLRKSIGTVALSSRKSVWQRDKNKDAHWEGYLEPSESFRSARYRARQLCFFGGAPASLSTNRCFSYCKNRLLTGNTTELGRFKECEKRNKTVQTLTYSKNELGFRLQIKSLNSIPGKPRNPDVWERGRT